MKYLMYLLVLIMLTMGFAIRPPQDPPVEQSKQDTIRQSTRQLKLMQQNRAKLDSLLQIKQDTTQWR